VRENFHVIKTKHLTTTLYIQAQAPSVQSVLMAEAAALTLAANITKHLNINSVTFLSDSQVMVNLYNSRDLENPLHWNIKNDTTTFLQALQTREFKVHKIPRNSNTTANSLAHQAFKSQSHSVVFTCTAPAHISYDSCPAALALQNVNLEPIELLIVRCC